MVQKKTVEVIGLFSESEAKEIERFVNSAGVRKNFLAEKAILKYILSPHKKGLQDGVNRRQSDEKKSVHVKFFLPEETYSILMDFCHPDPTQKRIYSRSKIIAQAIVNYIDTYNSQTHEY